nr:hypothetical protein CFP56_21381 [Quercus suber]
MLQMRKTKGKNVCGYLPLGESVEELTPSARVTAMETDSEDPKFPEAKAAETPESASVEHLATRSTDQDMGRAVQLTKTVWMSLLEPRALLYQRVLSFDSDMSTRVGNMATSTMTELEAFIERFEHKKYSARLAPRFWSLEGPQADFRRFNVQQDCVILLDQLVGRYGDFTAGFKIGAITDHFMINLLCEVLMDMHHSSLDTINETRLLEWGNVMRARDGTTRLSLLFSVRTKAKLEALEVRIADLKKLLGLRLCMKYWLRLLSCKGPSKLKNAFVTYQIFKLFGLGTC